MLNFLTPSKALGLIIIGALIILTVVFKQLYRKRRFGESYTKYIGNVKLRQPEYKNEFGENIRWLVDKNDDGEDSPEDRS